MSFLPGRAFPHALILLAATTAGAVGCAPNGSLLEDVIAMGTGNALDGEIRTVDSRRGRITIQDRNSRTHTLRTDRRTRVVHQQRQYPVSALERGDLVRVRVATDRDGRRWAERVDVWRSAREGGRDGRTASRTERIEGRVGRVDTRRGHFTLERGRGSTLVVHVPPRIGRDEARRFERLRRGDRVRADIRGLGRNEVELVRFR